MNNETQHTAEIDYFYNEKGDYTITHYGNPVAFVESEDSAISIKNTFSSMKMRIDVLSKTAESLSKEHEKLKEDYAVLSQLNNTVTEQRDVLRIETKRQLDFVASAPSLLKERDGLFKQNQEYRFRLSEEITKVFDLTNERDELKSINEELIKALDPDRLRSVLSLLSGIIDNSQRSGIQSLERLSELTLAWNSVSDYITESEQALIKAKPQKP
jgi:hypothetical protein